MLNSYFKRARKVVFSMKWPLSNRSLNQMSLRKLSGHFQNIMQEKCQLVDLQIVPIICNAVLQLALLLNRIWWICLQWCLAVIRLQSVSVILAFTLYVCRWSQLLLAFLHLRILTDPLNVTLSVVYVSEEAIREVNLFFCFLAKCFGCFFVNQRLNVYLSIRLKRITPLTVRAGNVFHETDVFKTFSLFLK